ncbi:MAG: hypothetical protein C4527_17105 [Candidatus Omnitrophota bacterium]|jgi:hypothetical protein|nr:MAG: hypothetical protein C4527_17105 [Candidatus Omnitrophota bacterium]
MDDSGRTNRERIERFVFKHVAEILIFSGLFLLIIVLFIPKYDQKSHVAKLVHSYHGLKTLVEALRIYSHDHLDNHAFPPDPDYLIPGILLCPIRSNTPANLTFLTTPVSFLSHVPIDPFLSEVDKHQRDLTPVVLHWVQTSHDTEKHPKGYFHIAWGALSVGPALELPPQYDITVLRRVPYESWPLRNNLFDPTNGLKSMGILYHDSLGNSTKL